jgi:hypothetical protein
MMLPTLRQAPDEEGDTVASGINERRQQAGETGERYHG